MSQYIIKNLASQIFSAIFRKMRSLQPLIERDLGEKFVFLAGPRQVGKTHLSKETLKKTGGRYYNWDLAEDRSLILEKGFLQDRFVVLDELHKYQRWKNFIKGIYDKYHEGLKALITGSARLDIYRKGGGSLFGRYFLFHLHPFSVGEIDHNTIPKPDILKTHDLPSPPRDLFETLFRWGGFPEPFFAASEERHMRWSLQRNEVLIREDLRDLTQINLLTLVEHLMLLLPARVGSVLSINGLKEDLQVAYNSVRSWLNSLERLYFIFMLQPYSRRINRSVHKEKKLYLWDWSQVKDEGDRFENFVASHLWKAVHLWRDLGVGNFELQFLRDRDRREVDFCILKDRLPWVLIEAKFSETRPHESLIYFSNLFRTPAVQLVAKKGVDQMREGVRVVSADRWLALLP